MTKSKMFDINWKTMQMSMFDNMTANMAELLQLSM